MNVHTQKQIQPHNGKPTNGVKNGSDAFGKWIEKNKIFMSLDLCCFRLKPHT